MRNLRLVFTAMMVLAFQVELLAQEKETRDVRDFDEVMMRVSGKVYVTQGDENEVVLEGHEELLEAIETEVSGGRLTIKNRRNRWRFWENNRHRLTVHITMKEVNGLYVSGSGDIIGKNTFKTDDVILSISGSGDIEVGLDAEYVHSKISGSGNIELEGKSDKAKLSISGSGKFFAEKMVVGDYEISMSGSGRGSVNVEGDLDVRISGSGRIYYMGKPTSVNTNVAGSGSIRRIN